MKIRNKKTKIILLSIAIFIGFIVFVLMWGNLELKKQLQKCPGIDMNRYGRDRNFDDCINNIAIDISHIPKTHYALWDIKHKHGIIGFSTKDNFKLISNIIYVFHLPSEEGSYSIEDGQKFYFDEYYIDGELKTFYYKTVDQMPRYFAIDTITGNVRLYKSLKEVPSAEAPIFQELEARYIDAKK